jgi:hypothetical protein
MGTLKKTVAIALSGLLLGGATAPAWSASANALAPINAEVMPATNAVEPSLVSFLKPITTDTELHQQRTNCKAPQLYSQHDVIGDPEACIMGQFNLPGGFTASGAGR